MAESTPDLWADRFDSLPHTAETMKSLFVQLGELGIGQDMHWCMPQFVDHTRTQRTLELRGSVPFIGLENRYKDGLVESGQLRLHEGSMRAAWSEYTLPRNPGKFFDPSSAFFSWRVQYEKRFDPISFDDAGPMLFKIGEFADDWLAASRRSRIPDVFMAHLHRRRQ